ncbi:hypothetical protein K402DRAFT_215981 [Aulographum hederae CBS 113979]|uniref:DUF985 domain-containing protein n=1 Tax=Aulographum hederae CBS 113979 TaxID=1176131 RepID=A0A6G1GMJ3_9PEZI|nr:hypothetical protein K402DRAFT_215981 [Aulographum hederae CBS 113979]
MSTSTIDPTLAPLTPLYTPRTPRSEPPQITSTLSTLALQEHIEGGYFAETDRDAFLVPNPFHSITPDLPRKNDDPTRNASTTIFYFVTPGSPQGGFHRNKARTVHTLHWGRGRYVVIHADEDDVPEGGKRVETFVVGKDISKGERLQWIVEGGKYKASYLLAEEGCEGEERNPGLLISETVVPGFDYRDHDFLTMERFEEVVGREEMRRELEWLVRKV